MPTNSFKINQFLKVVTVIATLTIMNHLKLKINVYNIKYGTVSTDKPPHDMCQMMLFSLYIHDLKSLISNSFFVISLSGFFLHLFLNFSTISF